MRGWRARFGLGRLAIAGGIWRGLSSAKIAQKPIVIFHLNQHREFAGLGLGRAYCLINSIFEIGRLATARPAQDEKMLPLGFSPFPSQQCCQVFLDGLRAFWSVVAAHAGSQILFDGFAISIDVMGSIGGQGKNEGKDKKEE